MKFIPVILFLLFSAIIAKAEFPAALPTTERSAFVWAVTKTRVILRDIWATPIGMVHIADQGGPIDTHREITLSGAMTGEKITAATREDKFKISLPTAKSNFNVWYRTNDGNPEVTMLEAYRTGSFVKSGNSYVIPDWFKEVTYYLSSEFFLETEADSMGIQFLGEDGNVTYQSIEPKVIGDKKYFVIPSHYFTRKDYQNGITTLYGRDENGNFQYRQYTNIDGAAAGTQFVDFNPEPVMANHFSLKPKEYFDGNFEAFLPVPSYQNTITDRSYEFVAGGPEGSTRMLFIYSFTAPYNGVGMNHFAIGATATEQAPDGVITQIRGVADTQSPGIILPVKSGYTYIFSVDWPEQVKHSDVWFN